jgi:hypothetical protein
MAVLGTSECSPRVHQWPALLDCLRSQIGHIGRIALDVRQGRLDQFILEVLALLIFGPRREGGATTMHRPGRATVSGLVGVGLEACRRLPRERFSPLAHFRSLRPPGRGVRLLGCCGHVAYHWLRLSFDRSKRGPSVGCLGQKLHRLPGTGKGQGRQGGYTRRQTDGKGCHGGTVPPFGTPSRKQGR